MILSCCISLVQQVSKKSPGSGGRPETKSNEDEGLSKKEKWQLKRQAQRLRKKQERESQSDTLKTSANISPLDSQSAVSPALCSDALTTRTMTVRHKPSVGTKRKADDQERSEFAAKKRQRTSRETSGSGNQQPASRKRMRPRKVRIHIGDVFVVYFLLFHACMVSSAKIALLGAPLSPCVRTSWICFNPCVHTGSSGSSAATWHWSGGKRQLHAWSVFHTQRWHNDNIMSVMTSIGAMHDSIPLH